MTGYITAMVHVHVSDGQQIVSCRKYFIPTDTGMYFFCKSILIRFTTLHIPMLFQTLLSKDTLQVVHVHISVLLHRITSENVAERYGVSRAKQDQMAMESHRK